MVFHWSLSDSKSPQVSWTLLNILAVLNNTVIWMVSTRLPDSKSSSPFNIPLITVPKAPITIGKIVTFMFYRFFLFSSKVEGLIFLFTFSQFYSVVSRNSKVDNFANFLLFFVVDYYYNVTAKCDLKNNCVRFENITWISIRIRDWVSVYIICPHGVV